MRNKVLFFCSSDIKTISNKYHNALIEWGFDYGIGNNEGPVQRLDSLERDNYYNYMLYRWIHTVQKSRHDRFIVDAAGYYGNTMRRIFHRRTEQSRRFALIR